MKPFSAKIQIIGVNPYVLLPPSSFEISFSKAGKDKGAIPVQLKIGDKDFIQNLVKYSGKWRLHLNGPMRKAAGKDVGDIIDIQVILIPGQERYRYTLNLKKHLRKTQMQKKAFEKLSPSRQKEILRYINFLKSEESVDKNIQEAISHLDGKHSFVGRKSL
jgi:hypothetical protein